MKGATTMQIVKHNGKVYFEMTRQEAAAFLVSKQYDMPPSKADRAVAEWYTQKPGSKAVYKEAQ
jgi:hypothetical protein